MKYRLTPKGKFRCWCWEHSKELIEMTSEVDFEMFDKLWPDIANIFGLDGVGYYISINDKESCVEDCTTCKHHNTPYDAIGCPCWNCKAGNSEYERQQN